MDKYVQSKRIFRPINIVIKIARTNLTVSGTLPTNRRCFFI